MIVFAGHQALVTEKAGRGGLMAGGRVPLIVNRMGDAVLLCPRPSG